MSQVALLQSAATRLLSAFGRILGQRFPPVENLPVDTAGGSPGIRLEIDLNTILRRYHERSTLIIAERAYDASGHPVDPALRLPRNPNRLSLVFFLSSDVPFQSTPSVLYFSSTEIDKLAEIANKGQQAAQKEFARFLLGRVSLRQHSPYQNIDPAMGRMFFNREPQINMILSETGWKAIVGPRRVGKSSLAQAVFARLAEDPARHVIVDGDPVPVLPAALVVCLDLATGDAVGDAVWEELYDQIGQKQGDRAEGRRHALTDPTKRRYRRLSPYESFLKLTTDRYTQPFVILDEVDLLIKRDRPEGWPFFHQLKGWAARVGASLILVGYVDLFDALKDDKFPFYRLVQAVPVSALPREAAVGLIRDPLAELGLEIDAALVDYIVQSTGAFPAQVQAACAEIVRRREEAPGSRVLPEDVDAAVAKAERAGGTYVSFMSEASPLARIVTYLAIEALAVAHASLSKLPAMGRDQRGALALLTPALQSWRLEYTELFQLLSRWVSWEALPESPRKLIYAALDELMLRGILKEDEQYRTYAFASGSLVVRLLTDHFTAGFKHDIQQATNVLAQV